MTSLDLAPSYHYCLGLWVLLQFEDLLKCLSCALYLLRKPIIENELEQLRNFSFNQARHKNGPLGQHPITVNNSY